MTQGYPESFKKLNPKAKVPALQVDDEVITENLAIFTYLSQLAPSLNLLGKTPMDAVRAYEWFSYLSGTVHGQAFGMFFAPQKFTDVKDGSLDKHVKATGIQMAKDQFKYINEKLEGLTWAIGDEFSAVDPYLFVFYQWGARVVQLPMEQDYPNYAAIAKKVAARESTQKMLKAEGLA